VKNPNREMLFLDHLEELRRRILWSLLAVTVCSAVGILAAIRWNVMDVLQAPLLSVMADVAADSPSLLGVPGDGRLVFLNLTEPFFFIIKLGMITGLLLASPIIVYHAWAFLAPALEVRERRMIIPSMTFGLLLFAAGVSLAYFVALPMTIRFLLLFGAEWFTPTLTAGYYLSLVWRILFAFGLVFELPVVVVILTSLGLVSPAFLRAKRRHAIVLITVLASIITPGDVFQITLLLMGPLILLYEVSIVLSTIIYRKRSRSEENADRPPEDVVPLLFVVGLATARWRNRRNATVAVDGV
jgi:sec-independent protein translocase protein TatC